MLGAYLLVLNDCQNHGQKHRFLDPSYQFGGGVQTIAFLESSQVLLKFWCSHQILRTTDLEIKKTLFLWFLQNSKLALAGVAHWIEHWPADQRVAASIPSQGTCLGRGPGPQGAPEATTQWCFSPCLSPSLPFSLKINKYNLFKK